MMLERRRSRERFRLSFSGRACPNTVELVRTALCVWSYILVPTLRVGTQSVDAPRRGAEPTVATFA